MSARDRFQRMPDPSNIATINMLNERFSVLDEKVNSNNKDTKESLKRIENKLDSLVLSLASRQRSYIPNKDTVEQAGR